MNRLGAICFAQETGKSLTDFFSDDSPHITKADPEEAKGVKRVTELTSKMKDGLWLQPPSSTDKHIAGKLSLFIGLPVMIQYNFATEMCMTQGQEGFVHGWQSKKGFKWTVRTRHPLCQAEGPTFSYSSSMSFRKCGSDLPYNHKCESHAT